MSATDPNRLDLELIPPPPPPDPFVITGYQPSRYRCPIHGEIEGFPFSFHESNGHNESVICCGRCLIDLIRQSVPCYLEEKKEKT